MTLPDIKRRLDAATSARRGTAQCADAFVELKSHAPTDIAYLLDALKSAEKERDAALAAVGVLTEALEFYADPDTYFAIGFFPDRSCGEFIEDFSDAGEEPYDDGTPRERPGKRAREVLSALRQSSVEALPPFVTKTETADGQPMNAVRVCILTDSICSSRCTDRCAKVANAKPGDWYGQSSVEAG